MQFFVKCFDCQRNGKLHGVWQGICHPLAMGLQMPADFYRFFLPIYRFSRSRMLAICSFSCDFSTEVMKYLIRSKISKQIPLKDTFKRCVLPWERVQHPIFFDFSFRITFLVEDFGVPSVFFLLFFRLTRAKNDGSRKSGITCILKCP